VDKCVLNKSIVVSSLNVASLREIEETRAYVEHGETENIREVKLNKREVIWNKCTQLMVY
jgi:hypothetical protein